MVLPALSATLLRIKTAFPIRDVDGNKLGCNRKIWMWYEQRHQTEHTYGREENY